MAREDEEDDFRTEPPPPPGAEEAETGGSDERVRRKRLEKMLRDLIRRGIEKGIEAGIGTFNKTDDVIRGVPKEVAGYVFSQIDETKNALVRVVAREVREFLEATDLATELRKALTSLSFQINTEIRFVPNEQGTGVKPDVKTKVTPRRSTPPPPGEDEDEPT